jgi:hypothetical protein
LNQPRRDSGIPYESASRAFGINRGIIRKLLAKSKFVAAGSAGRETQMGQRRQMKTTFSALTAMAFVCLAQAAQANVIETTALKLT